MPKLEVSMETIVKEVILKTIMNILDDTGTSLRFDCIDGNFEIIDKDDVQDELLMDAEIMCVCGEVK